MGDPDSPSIRPGGEAAQANLGLILAPVSLKLIKTNVNGEFRTMYALLSQLSVRRVAAEQLPIVVTSLVIAELFYKFHSFTLEAIAFLATWYAIDALVNWLSRVLRS